LKRRLVRRFSCALAQPQRLAGVQKSMLKSCLVGMLLSASSLAATTTESSLDARLKAVGDRLGDFKQRIDKCRAAGQDVSYPMVSYTVLENFVPFMTQDLDISVPNGWGWSGINGNVSELNPTHDAHSGRWGIKIFNKTAFAPNVYGLGENSIAFKVKPKTVHTLSVWAKCQDAGGLSFPVNGGWSDRLAIESTGGTWKRFEKTFTTEGDGWTPRILIEKPTDEVLIDDVVLVEGEKADEGKNLIPNGGFEDSWSAERVMRELPDLEKMADRLDEQLKRAEAGDKLPKVPRWSGDHRPTIRGANFIDSTGRPIFFVGYGHFKQARNDIEKFPGYGINIIQCGEWGPSAVYTAEGKFDDKMIKQTLDELDRGAKAGVAVDLLISPHYFPNWLLEKYPDSRKGRTDFFPYSIYHPKVRELLVKFNEEVLPRFKDKAALFSICLSNEPINAHEPDEYSTKAWREWLAKKHGDIATLNKRWKTSFGKIDEVEEPNALNQSKEPRPGGQWMDFVRWNQESFTEFHKLLADSVKKALPDVPVHIKDTTWHKYRSEGVQAGNDVTLYGGITDINGNDSVNLYGFEKYESSPIERGNDVFAQGWRENAIGYDLQRSAHDVPVFNSENHPIFDRETRYVPAEHIRACYWQGAIYGQSATTTWVWEREKSNPRGDEAGSIMERPACTEALGIVCHDLNRAAKEVAAIENAKPDVWILQSFTSAVWEPHRYDDALVKLYTALSFTGLKIGFVTERQLEAGTVNAQGVMFVPDTVHLSDAAFAGLQKLRGKVVFLGDSKLLTKNEYDEARAATLSEGMLVEPVAFKTDSDWQKLWESLLPRLAAMNLKPLVDVRDETGAAVWGVNWRCGNSESGDVVNLYNARREPVTVTLHGNAGAKFVDVLSGKEVADGKLTLAPLEVRLCRVSK
jgi:hypothetical protein